MSFPPIGVTAVIAGMAVFNRDAAIVQNRLQSINRAARQMEAESVGASGGAAAAFAGFASTLTTVGVTAIGAFALASGAAIKFAADFEQSLATTRAITGANDDQMAALEKTIINLSRNGTLSLEQLSQAATELARSGVEIPDVLNGALKAVQDLTIASGGEIGLEKSAKLVATAMNAFGISVDEVDRVTTAATVVAQNSALTFTDFGTAVQYAGATFKAAGFTIEDLATAEALLGKNGITGSVAATSLRGVIQRLIRPSKDAAEVMQKYGIHLFDAAGNAVGFDAVMQQLNTAFSDQAVAEGKLTEEERLRAISTLGLQRTGAAFLILSNATRQELDDLRASFERLKVTDLVAIQLGTLNAQVQTIKNNVIALATVFGQQFIPQLKGAASEVVRFLQGISTDQAAQFGQSVFNAVQTVTSAIGSLVGGVGELIKAFGLGDAAAQFLKSTLIGLAVIVAVNLAGGIAAAVGGWLLFAAVVGGATVAIAAVSGAVHDLGYQFANWLAQFGPLGEGVSHFVRAAADGFGALQALLTGDFDRALSLANQSFYGFISSIRVDGGKALQYFQDRIAEAGGALAPWAAQAGAAGTAVSEALSGVSGVVLSLQFLLQGNLPAASLAAQQAIHDFAASFSTISNAIQSAVQPAITWLTDTAFPAIQSTFQSISESLQRAFANLGIFQQLQTIVSNVITTLGNLVTIVANVAQGIGSLIQIVLRVAQGFGDAQGSSAALDVAMTALLLPFKALVTTAELVSNGLTALIGWLARGSIAFNQLAQSAESATPSAGAFSQAFQTAGTTVGNVFQTMGTVANQALVVVVAAIMQLPGEISGALSAVETTVSTAWATVLSITQAIWSAIPADIRQNLEQIVDNVGAILNDVVALEQAILAIAAQVAKAAWEEIVLDATFEFNVLKATVEALIQATVDLIINTLSTLQQLVLGPIGQFEAALFGALAAMAATAEGLALNIAGSIISGLVSGITSGISRVTGAIRGLMDAAVSAAQSSIAAHSPSRVFAEIGQDAGEGLVEGIEDMGPVVEASGASAGYALATGLIEALDQMKAPVRASAAGLVDQALSALTGISDRAEQLMADTEIKMAAVGETVGRKINEAIRDAAEQIERTIADATNRINDLQESLSQSRSDRSRREALQRDQDARRQARRTAQEDADAAAAHQKDLDDATFKKTQDIAKAQAKAQQDLTQATTDKQRAAVQARLDDELAAADVSYRQAVDRIDRQFQLEEADRLARRDRQQEDAEFERQLEQETQNFNDQLEEEALARSIDRTIKERDARIDAINKALTDKQEKLRADAALELLNLEDNVRKRLAVLEDEFAKKAADLLRKGGENMRPLVENIQQILSGNFAAMRDSAQAFTNTVGEAINALKRLEEARRRAQFDAPSLPSPTQNLEGVPDVQRQFENTPLPQFQHGGLVPGPYGKPVVAVVHGGEFIASMDSAAARMARAMAGASSPSAPNVYNYNVNATYAQTQSPATVEMDMRALIQMART